MLIAKDDEQFKNCTNALSEAIKKGEISKDSFTPRQLAQIQKGEARIHGLTWHHHQVTVKMQLVNSEVHSVNHLGGKKLWGGGIR